MDRLPRPPKWRRYLRFWRSDVVADVDEELKFHLEARADDLIAGGVAAEAARAQALAEMGELSVVREQLMTIDERVLRKRSSLERWRVLGGEFRYALRRLRGTPGFTIAATLTMAIAIGATGSVFGLVDGVLLKAFPFRDPSRVLTLWDSNILQNFPKVTVSAGDYVDWRAQSHAFAGFAAAEDRDFTVIGRQESESVSGLSVTPGYFTVLGISPVAGRALASDSGGPPEVVIGYNFWQRRFGGAPGAVGQALTLASGWLKDTSYTIVGVMPPGLPGPGELWTRLSFTPRMVMGHQGSEFQVFARLKPGVSREAAQTEMKTIAQRVATADPGMRKNWTVLTVPLLDQLVGGVRPALLLLLAAAACVLLIGVANIANLFLVRCLARQRELAVRTALGATRRRLVWELLVEVAILGVGAGALGIAGTFVGVRALRTLAPATLPRLTTIGVDARLVAFCAAASFATILIFGLLPAWQVSRGDVADVLTEGGRGTGSAGSRALQDGLVVLQVAVALVLLAGGGLFVESFIRFARMDPGFRPEGVLTARIALDPARYPTPERAHAFFKSLLGRLAAQPGVDAAGVGDPPPGTAAGAFPIPFIGNPPFDPARVDWAHFDWAHAPTAGLVEVSPDYFRAMGIRLLRGRGILPTDDDRALNMAVVDEELARRYFGDTDPIGQRLAFWCGKPPCPTVVEIVGVAAAVKQGGLAADEAPTMYLPVAQYPTLATTVAVRTKGEPVAFTAMLRRVISGLDPAVPLFDVQTMNERMAQSVGATRFSTFLASLFAAVAVGLSIIGIYSVLTYIVSQRRREIGIRIALGAGRTRVMDEVVRRALALTGIGIVLGLFAAWMLTRAVSSLFLGVSPHDPRIFVGAAVVFAVTALAAASIPALRATRVNPVAALTSL